MLEDKSGKTVSAFRNSRIPLQRSSGGDQKRDPAATPRWNQKFPRSNRFKMLGL